jgi:3-dehydroquinate dehydratase-2
MTRVLILNGPNLGRLGVREPDIYGNATLADVEAACAQLGAELGLETDLRQTDDETEMVHWLHEAADEGLHVLINPAAFTHYSYSMRDAAAQVTKAGQILIEVHISNPAGREEFRAISVIAAVATGTVAGFGAPGSYLVALHALAGRLKG